MDFCSVSANLIFVQTGLSKNKFKVILIFINDIVFY